MKRPFEILHRLSSAISKAGKLEEIYEIILEEIVQAMGVARASIMRFDPKDQLLKIVAAKGIKPEIWKSVEIRVGEGVSGQVWQEGKPLLIKKMQPNPRYQSHSYMITPVTAFPMKVRSLPIGLINLTDKKSGKPFTESDLKLLMTISDQVASYMHIYDLVEQLKSGEEAKLQLELAREIQQRLLPKAPPKIKGLEVAGTLIPAERVGADYYDYFGEKVPEKCLAPSVGGLDICVADVSGHSVAGALLAFALRACLKIEAANGKRPSEIIERANKILFSDLLQSEQFLSLFYAQYLPAEGKLKFTNAGHNPPLLWQHRKRNEEWLLTQDSLLGIDSNLNFHEKEILFEKGDVLALYTDGLVEALGSKGERFGAVRLVQSIQENAEKTATEILSRTLESWKKFVGQQPIKDDVTMVIMKRT